MVATSSASGMCISLNASGSTTVSCSASSDICVFGKDVKNLSIRTGYELQQRKAHKSLMQWQEVALKHLCL